MTSLSFDGPPYANGPPLGHAQNKTSGADIINRYGAGRRASRPYVPGWTAMVSRIEHKAEWHAWHREISTENP